MAPTHYDWGFQLNGNSHWLENYKNHFISVDVGFIGDYEDHRPAFYEFTSSHLNGLPGTEAAMRANELLILVNGMMRVKWGFGFRPFALGEGRHYWKNERARLDHHRSRPVPMFPEDVEMLRYHRDRWPLSEDGKALFLSRSDRYLRVMFRTLGREGLTFVSLSKVLDTINAELHASGKGATRANLATLGGKTENDIECFTYTANNFDVGGEDARHGLNAKFKATDRLRQLTLEEAADVILPIARGLLKQRVAETFGPKWEAVLVDRAAEADPPPPRPEPQ